MITLTYCHSVALHVAGSMSVARCLSVGLSHLSTAACRCGTFAAVGSVGKRYPSIAVAAAFSSKCEQCHTVS